MEMGWNTFSPQHLADWLPGSIQGFGHRRFYWLFGLLFDLRFIRMVGLRISFLSSDVPIAVRCRRWLSIQ